MATPYPNHLALVYGQSNDGTFTTVHRYWGDDTGLILVLSDSRFSGVSAVSVNGTYFTPPAAKPTASVKFIFFLYGLIAGVLFVVALIGLIVQWAAKH